MKAIVGLGNPGLQYRESRHNLGFLVIRDLARGVRIRINKKGFYSLFGKGAIEQQPVLLAMPVTYMNLSGKAVKSLVKQQKIALEDLLVVCDDVNLELGVIRLKASGSPGGHNGLSSIVDSLGTRNFARLRVGVGVPAGKKDLTGHVLGNFKSSEIKVLNQTVERAVNCCRVWASAGPVTAMNRFNWR